MNEIKLPFGFGEIIRNAPERAAAAIDEKDGMRLTALLLAPDMELEGKILKAINEVKSFDVLADGKIGLYDEDAKMVLLLEK